MSFKKMNKTAEVQFGNPGDTSGFRITNAKILGELTDRIVPCYLVQDGKTFGVATAKKLAGMYYCTQAVTVNSHFTAVRVANMLNVPVVEIVNALQA